ncbi:hypothetical protein ACJ41O_008881 [Fusarium nematophilum]
MQCDESKPQCGNCIRFGVACDFSPTAVQPIPASTAASGSGPGRRGRPRSDWSSWAEQIRRSSGADASGGCPCSNQQGLNVADLELLYHYLTSTADTLGNENDLWRHGAPRLGFQNPCILSLILCLSSYHLSRLNLADSARYLRLAEQHSTTALQAATVLLTQLNPQTSPALYIVSVLICFVSFAKGPAPGDMLLVAEHGQVAWLHLLKGVKLVIETSGWPAIFSGPLAEYFPGPSEKHEELAQSLSPLQFSEDWRSSLNEVSSLIALLADQRMKDACEDGLRVLEECCEKTFGRGQNSSLGVVGRMEVVMSWIYGLDDAYVEGLGKKNPVPLIVLGHYCVLLRTVEQFWFIDGWAAHIMAEILRASEATRRWLSWPIAYLGG